MLAELAYMPSSVADRHRQPTLMRWAIAYVPSGCSAEPSKCRLHVNYHGCTGVKWAKRLSWVRNLDLNEYAEANDIVVLYPQARGSKAVGTGCWNWVSYKNDPQFDTKLGRELRTVTNIAADLAHALAAAAVTQGEALPPGAARDEVEPTDELEDAPRPDLG